MAVISAQRQSEAEARRIEMEAKRLATENELQLRRLEVHKSVLVIAQKVQSDW